MEKERFLQSGRKLCVWILVFLAKVFVQVMINGGIEYINIGFLGYTDISALNNIGGYVS